MQADDSDRAGARLRQERTARLAVLAGLPGLALTALAALGADALVLHADLVLTLLDLLVLGTAWLVALRARPAGRSSDRRAETLVCTLAALCMTLSMALVVWVAVARLAQGGAVPSGSGVLLGLLLNGGYAAVNLWILRRWRRRWRQEPSPFVRSQLCLFCDKLATNLLVAASMAVVLAAGDTAAGRYADPVAGLLIAAATFRWLSPVLRDLLREAGRAAALAR